jgi:hypothetical protein
MEAVQLFVDQMPSPLQCLFQVKSTSGTRGRCSVKLTNWLRFIHSPLPTFFLVLEFDGTDECQRGYLVHVGEDHIERVLRRIREITAADSQENWQDYTIDVRWGEENRISSLNGRGFVAAVRSHTSAGIENYLTWKRTILADVGYESARTKLRINPRVPDEWTGTVQQLLIDFGLGLISHLEIEAGEMVDLRFGIPKVLSEPLSKGTRLEIVQHRPSGRGSIQLRIPGSDTVLELHADVFLPHGVNVPDELLKARYSIPFVDVIFEVSAARKIDFKLKLPELNTKHQLTDLQPVADLILLFNHAVAVGVGQLEVQTFFNDARIGSGKLTNLVTPPNALVAWAERVKSAWGIARHFEIERDVVVSAAELVEYRRQLHLISLVLGRRRAWLEVRFTLNAVVADAEDSQLQWCFPIAATVRLGRYRVQVSFIVVGEPCSIVEVTETRPWFSVRTDQVKSVNKSLVRDPNSMVLTDIEVMEALANEFADKFNVAVLRQLPWLTQES